MNRFRATAVWTGEAWLPEATVVVDEGQIVEVRPPARDDPPAMEGLILPGLVNAHTHLELSWAAGRVPEGLGFSPWLRALTELGRPTNDKVASSARKAARRLAGSGTAAVCDISNAGDTAPQVVQAGLVGVVQHELLGMDPADQPERLALSERPIERSENGRVWTRPSPHSCYSTAPALLRAAARPGPVHASIHAAEHPAEFEFIAHGTGPMADLLNLLGRDWSWFEPRGESTVAYLDRLELLGPALMLVHGVHLSGADRELLVSRGVRVCLCPRSNLHIGGVLPEAPALLEAGIPLALGTDSLASAPDLDVLGEIAVLVEAFPAVDPSLWLRAATAGGADALGLDGVGRLMLGTSPGLLFLDGVEGPEDLGVVPERRWLVRCGDA